MLYDITMPMEAALAVWPGDAPYRMEWTLRIAEGSSVNLGSIGLSVHAGTHADAPYHYDSQGKTIEQVPLETYVGPACVIEVQGKALIRAEDLPLASLAQTPRLLIKTGAWQDRTRFPEQVPVIAPEVPALLRQYGVRLLGVDVPSVDPLESKDLPLHHALGQAGIVILESLQLEAVPAGRYELIALPLKLVGMDGSPVRAMLRSLA